MENVEKILIRIEVHIGDKILEAEEEYVGAQTFINLVAAAKRGIAEHTN
jgi:hypothetical protein